MRSVLRSSLSKCDHSIVTQMQVSRELSIRYRAETGIVVSTSWAFKAACT